MNSYINGILQFIRNNDKYHQIAMILSLLILLILLLFQLSKIQDNRKLLINAKSDFAYVEERFNLIANKISLNQLINCLLYTSPSPRDKRQSRMPSSA